MKSIIALALLATGVLAAPTELASRQSRSTRTDLEDGDAADCPSAILVFARGTGEAGNLVSNPADQESPTFHPSLFWSSFLTCG